MSPELKLITLDDIVTLIDDCKKHYGIASDAELARRMGVSYMAVYRWRRGQVEPSTLALMTIARSTPSTDSALALYSAAA